MAIAKAVQTIHDEVRAYLTFMAEQNRSVSQVYLSSKQVAQLKRQADKDGVKWHPVIDGYPIKVWNA